MNISQIPEIRLSSKNSRAKPPAISRYPIKRPDWVAYLVAFI